MTAFRFKLPFGKLPLKISEGGEEQWLDYCAVTDVSSASPDEVVLVDMDVSGVQKVAIVRDSDISIANPSVQATFEISPTDKVGLPAYYEENEQ